MIKLGITGGIGSGKSVISALLRIADVPVYDSDSRAKDLQTSDQDLRRQLIEVLGAECYLTDGQLNKPFIANKIFNDKQLLSAINNIVHPAVWKDFEQWAAQQADKGHQIVGFESAILFQSHLNERFDYIWTVEAPTDVCIERACKRDNKQRELIEARIKNQQPVNGLGDTSINNDGRHSLIEQVMDGIAKLRLQAQLDL